MTSASPRPIPTGSIPTDLQAVMTWIQNVQEDTQAPTGLLRVRSVSTPYPLTLSDRIVRVTVVADHDLVTLPNPAAAFSGSLSPVFTVTKADATGNTCRVVNGGGGQVQYAAYYTLAHQGDAASFYTNGTDYFVK